MTDNKVEVKDETFYYTEYGYRGLEEIRLKDKQIEELKKRIEDLEKKIQPQYRNL